MKIAILVAACLLCLAGPASAHRIDEYLQATILSLQAGRVDATMRLVPGVAVAPSVIVAIDGDHDGTLSPAEKKAYAERVLAGLSLTIDGRSVRPVLDAWDFPAPVQMRGGIGEIQIAWHADLPPGAQDTHLILTNKSPGPRPVYLMNATVPLDHRLRISAQRRNETQSVYELDYRQAAGAVTAMSAGRRVETWLEGLPFYSLFHLGMRHIAEGADHLLFLLVLLLPAPLLAAGGRWNRPAGTRQSLLHILGIVTAFTLGHSITLGLAAMDVVRVPEHPVEVLIAVSILVSAVHAVRPLFPGREAWIAASFGLVHGLAFAATLDRLGLTRWDRVGGILAFNLGIEAMQMLVVAAILPSLILLSRTRAYRPFRIGGALFAGAASLGWIVERLFDVQMPVDAIVSTIARHAFAVASLLFMASVLFRCLTPLSAKPAAAENAQAYISRA